MCIVRSNQFENARNLLAGYSKSSPKPQHFFYISMLFYPILVSLDKNILGKKLEFCAEPRKKLHISSHGSSVKVGVKQKTNLKGRKPLKKQNLYALFP